MPMRASSGSIRRNPAGSFTYSYDDNGNRLTSGSTSHTYDAADEMLTAGGVGYGYDSNGNQTSRSSDTFTYDHENRLTQSVIGGVTSSSTYNGDGLRMSHTVSGNTTNYTSDVGSSVPEILKDNANTYVYGLDLISKTESSGTQKYYLHNGIGSVSMITSDDGWLRAEYYYSEFGLPSYAWEYEVGPNDRRFAGEQRDADSGMYYLRARYYDPATGRFLSQDPVPASNRYWYAANNPVNLTDPSGMWPDWEDVVDTVVNTACSNSVGSAVGCGLVGLGPLGDSYFDLNVTFGCFFVYSFGTQYSADQGFHPYYGAGVGTCGGSASFTAAPGQDITTGRNCGLQGGYIGPFVGGSAQFGGAPIGIDKEGNFDFSQAKPFWELGPTVGFPPGSFSVSATCILVGSLGPLSW